MTLEAIAQLAVLANKLPTLEQTNEALGLLDSLEAEIERLTSELVETQDALEVTRGAIPNLMDQVERLRATMRRIAFDDEGRKRDYLGPDVYDDVEAALAALDSEPPTRAGVKLEDAYRGLER